MGLRFPIFISLNELGSLLGKIFKLLPFLNIFILFARKWWISWFASSVGCWMLELKIPEDGVINRIGGGFWYSETRKIGKERERERERESRSLGF